MSLPNVTITRSNGNLNRVESTTDNVFAFLLSGAAVADKINLGQAYLVTGLGDLDTLGITEANNALAFAEITAFYGVMGDGARLYLMLYADTTLMATVCNRSTGIVRDLLDFGEEGKRGLFVNKKLPVGYTISLTDGLDADVWNTVTELQALCQAYDADNNSLFAVVPGFGFTAANASSLRDLSTMTANMVSILLGSDAQSGKPACAVLAAQLAKYPLQQNAGMVANGAPLQTAYFLDGTAANSKTLKSLLNTIHDRRYIFFRKFPNKTGYYFNDDPTACKKSDDFSSISWNRVINKAKIVSAATLVEKLNSDVESNGENGAISPALAGDWEGDVERQLKFNLVDTGNATRVGCEIDTVQSNLQTDSIIAAIKVIRKGQAKQFNVSIGYALSI